MEVCIYDRIVYIVKKGINIFSKKGVLRGCGTNYYVGNPMVPLEIGQSVLLKNAEMKYNS